MKLSHEELKIEIKELKDALAAVIQSKTHERAIAIAGEALDWPTSAKEALDLLNRENDKLKKLLEEAIKKQFEPKQLEPKRYGGWHLCDRCRKVVFNGQTCKCESDVWRQIPPSPYKIPYTTHPIWCGHGDYPTLQVSGALPTPYPLTYGT